MSDAPSSSDLIRIGIAKRLEDMHVSMPGRVVSYDKSKQSATVQPLLRRWITTQVGRVLETIAPIHHVPVRFEGAGGYSSTFPLTAGDCVWLVFADSAIDRWLTGGDIHDPRDDRRFALRDCVAIPGVRSYADALDDVSADAWVFTTPTKIKLGDHTAGQAAVRGDTFKDNLDELLFALKTFADANLATGGGALVAAVEAFMIEWPSMLSTKVDVY